MYTVSILQVSAHTSAIYCIPVTITPLPPALLLKMAAHLTCEPFEMHTQIYPTSTPKTLEQLKTSRDSEPSTANTGSPSETPYPLRSAFPYTPHSDLGN